MLTSELKKQVFNAYSSKGPPFYRNLLSEAVVPTSKSEVTEDFFVSLPVITYQDLIETPLEERDYNKNKELIKIVRKGDGRPFFIARTLDDIQKEPYGIEEVERPLCAFTYCYEALEKALWFYEHNILPIINEENDEITRLMIDRFEIDGLVCDSALLKRLLPYLIQTKHIERVKCIKIVDSTFDENLITEARQYTNVKCLLGLPETGTLAHVDVNGLCRGLSSNYYEEQNSNLVVTCALPLPTPIIRYNTELVIREYKQNKEGVTFVLQ